MLLLLRVCRCCQMGGYILLLQIVELVNFGGSMWLDDDSSRSLCRRRSQPPIFPGLFLGRAGERHCDLVLDRVTRQLRAAHQRAAIKTCRWGVRSTGPPTSRVGEGRVGELATGFSGSLPFYFKKTLVDVIGPSVGPYLNRGLPLLCSR